MSGKIKQLMKHLRIRRVKKKCKGICSRCGTENTCRTIREDESCERKKNLS